MNTTDKVLHAFLEEQGRQAMSLAQRSDILDLMPVDEWPPSRYIAVFKAKGLAQAPDGRIREEGRCDVGISLPDCYLRDDADLGHMPIVTCLGPERPWHPQFMVHLPRLVCVQITPGTSLCLLLHAIYELWTYGRYSTRDNGFNPNASAWLRGQDLSRFPLERRPLTRRAPRPPISVRRVT